MLNRVGMALGSHMNFTIASEVWMKRILVIDDDEKIRLVFERFLKKQGYAVTCAEDGKEGLRSMDEETPHLVITDIMMPNADGLEVALSMREKHPDIPVIAISGGAKSMSMDFLPLIRKFGACNVFYKPVELSDLLKGVRELIGD